VRHRVVVTAVVGMVIGLSTAAWPGPSANATGTISGRTRTQTGPISGAPSPTPAAVLSELGGLATTSIESATGDPDNGYTPVPTAKDFGVDGTDAHEEGNTRVVDGQLASEVVISAQGARSVAKVTAHICPDAGGLVFLHIAMTVGSATGDDQLFEADARGHADDDARLTSPSVTVTKGKGSDAARLKRLGLAVLHKAETAWRNGYCVKVDVTDGGSRTVKPQEIVNISATAKPRFGAGTIGGRMESKRTGGTKKVGPATATGSPSKFTYTAPDKKPGTGSVELRSVSKRGIGLADLEYTTEGDLKVDAVLSSLWHLTGVKCGGPAGTWDLTGTLVDAPGGFGNEHFIVTFPKDSLSGTWHTSSQVVAGPGSVSLDQSGVAHYTAAPDGTTGTLDFSQGSVPVTTGTFCKNGSPVGG